MEINSTQPVAEATQESKAINVKIVGHELISKKLFDVVIHLLMSESVHEFDDCVRAVVFTEDEPEGKFGGFRLEDKHIIVNMQSHFDYATEVLEDEKLALLGIRSHIWFGMLTTIIHEILHAVAYAIDPETVLNTDRKTLEDNLNEETAIHLRNLIRDYDVEPPEFADDPFFGPRYLEFYSKKIKENAEQWAIQQKAIHETGVIWRDDDVSCDTFRDWYRISYKHHEDAEWDKDPSPLLVADVEDEVLVEQLDTDDLTSAQAVIELPAGPVETVAEVAAQPTGEVIVAEPTPNLDIDPESLAALYNAEEPMDMPDYHEGGGMVQPYSELVAHPELGPAAAPAPAPQPVVETPKVAPQIPTEQTALPLKTETAQAEARCRSCQNALQTGAKFCGFCGTGVEETPMPEMAPVAPVHTPNPMYPQAPLNTQLPNHNLTAEQIRACVGDIFMRCWHHIYTKCGFSPGQNPQFAPQLRNAVAEPISVVGVPCVDKVLVAMDCTDQMGKYQKHAPVVNGMITGKITKTQSLPSYTLYFNFNGIEVKRLILPQNMWKVNGQAYSRPAVRAQQGSMIAWLIDGDDTTPGKKWKAKIENGQLEWLV